MTVTDADCLQTAAPQLLEASPLLWTQRTASVGCTGAAGMVTNAQAATALATSLRTGNQGLPSTGGTATADTGIASALTGVVRLTGSDCTQHGIGALLRDIGSGGARDSTITLRAYMPWSGHPCFRTYGSKSAPTDSPRSPLRPSERWLETGA